MEIERWGVEEVLAWVVGVARQRFVPVEDADLHRFLGLNGRRLSALGRAEMEMLSPRLGSALFDDLERRRSLRLPPRLPASLRRHSVGQGSGLGPMGSMSSQHSVLSPISIPKLSATIPPISPPQRSAH